MLPLLVSLVWLLLCANDVVADTEIINFDALPPIALGVDLLPPQVSSWPVLGSDKSKQIFEVLPAPLGTPLEDVCEETDRDGRGWDATKVARGGCPYELWVVLDIDSSSWVPFSKFTLRLSWPANFPTRFDMKSYTPSEVSTRLTNTNQPPPNHSYHAHSAVTTRRQYARIRLVDTGVRTPTSSNLSPSQQQPVPFVLVLEPLYFGFLPKSVIPIVAFIIPSVLVVGALVVPSVYGHLMGIADEVRAEAGLVPTGRDKRKKTS